MMHDTRPPSPGGAPTTLNKVAITPTRMSAGAGAWVAIAIFAQESVWNFYEAQVPAQLRGYLSSATLIGLIMGMDTAFGVFVQPVMGRFSDLRARHRFGRWPIIVAGACLAAIPFTLIPWATSLPALMMCVVCFGLTANAFKGVTETLVSDYVAAGNRSKAQGFIKAGVSLTIVVSSLISLLVVDHSLKAAFAIPPLVMLIAIGLASWFPGRDHARRRLPAQDEAEPDAAAHGLDESASSWAVIKDVVRDPSRSRLLMVGIFCFAGMWSALRAMTTPYGIEVLGMSRGQAGAIALPGAIAFLIAVVPIAYLSSRVGQVRAIRRGVALFVAGLLTGFAAPNASMTAAAMAISSVGYAVFAVNALVALVALWNLAPNDRVLGAYTGLYTIASASGISLGPALLGITMDLTGWRSMLLNAAVFAAITFAVFTSLARRTAASARTA
ncbi:MFS transporter [Streptomyces sp. NBC_01136]|uniref:MFS transporter n=1 Tax=unclassified Streptomyces TaxID=2593676 RepID=UPI0032511B0A|nr:MFS transporter [Streptomyces sp. NBC_01136]